MYYNNDFDIVFGNTGSGKSTYLAYLANKAIAEGKNVYSNVPISGTFKFKISDLYVYDISDGLIIFEEAGQDFNNRNSRNAATDKINEKIYMFFTLHRHYNLDVVFACQDWERLDKIIRELVKGIFLCRPTFLKRWFVRVDEIRSFYDIIEGQILKVHEFVPRLQGGVKYISKKKAQALFDSFSRDELPTRNFEVWD